jgi:hypothetical protein
MEGRMGSCSSVSREDIIEGLAKILKQFTACECSKDTCELHKQLVDLNAQIQTIGSKYLEKIQFDVSEAFGLPDAPAHGTAVVLHKVLSSLAGLM